jgi:Ca-activated chloride channel family protein
MTFAAPERLWLLAVVIALVIAYGAVQQRRRVDAQRFASPSLLPLLVTQRPPWWRHIVAGLLAAGLVVGVVGAAQPTVPGTREREQATIIVAIDNSDSMAATDVTPDRITAAAEAARDFVADLPAGFSVGLVSANGSPSVLVAPTTDHQRVLAALGRLDLKPNTALGEAIFIALAALPVPPEGAPRRAPAASVVLLSDGKTTTGRPDRLAVEAAVEAGVPVSTIAFGTDDPNVTVESQGHTVPVPVDESALRAIAEGTEGQFFAAASRGQLRSVYEAIDAEVTTVPIREDVAEFFAAGALILLLIAAGASLLAGSRLVWT